MTSNMKMFQEKVLAIVRKIPRGKTMTYKEVAIAAGLPRGARGVGAIMRGNYDESVPCHRVVRSDGTSGGYNRGRALKLRILMNERQAMKRKNPDPA